jgi:hypothetical protein
VREEGGGRGGKLQHENPFNQLSPQQGSHGSSVPKTYFEVKTFPKFQLFIVTKSLDINKCRQFFHKYINIFVT